MTLRVRYLLFVGALIIYSCSTVPEKRTDKKPVITYQEIEKEKISENFFLELEVPQVITEENQSDFPVKINSNYSGPFLIGISNQYQYKTSQKLSQIPIKLSTGEFLLMATVLDNNGDTFQGATYSAARIATASSKSNIMVTVPTIWVNYVKKRKGKVLIDYQVLDSDSSDYQSVRIYLDDRYLLEQKSPKRIIISGVQKGRHMVRFEVTDQQGNPLSGSFARVERRFEM